MIALLGATAVTLAALQAAINAPTDAFRSCLREASTKASNDKVGADAIDGYLRSACSVQMDSLKSAVVTFRTKNGMSKKAAAEDADMTVEDYLAAPIDKYKFMVELNTPKAQQPAAVTPAAQPAAAAQPPKQ